MSIELGKAKIAIGDRIIYEGGGGSPLPSEPIRITIPATETHTLQPSRSLLIENNKIKSTIETQFSCLGTVSFPITMPANTSILIVKYDLIGLSVVNGSYPSTIFCTDEPVVSENKNNDKYGNAVLGIRALSVGQSFPNNVAVITAPKDTFYFNICFGTGSFENLEIFAFNPDVKSENYIFNVGDVGFNTGYIHTANTKIKFKAEVETIQGGYRQAFGARSNNKDANAFAFFMAHSGSRYCYNRTGNEVYGDWAYIQNSVTTPELFSTCIYTFDGTKATWKNEATGVEKSLISTGTVDSGIAPIAIFCGNNSTSEGGWSPQNYGYMKLYWFEIYEGDELVRRYVPAYTNNYCLYDEVTETYLQVARGSANDMRGFINKNEYR